MFEIDQINKEFNKCKSYSKQLTYIENKLSEYSYYLINTHNYKFYNKYYSIYSHIQNLKPNKDLI